LSRYQCPSG